MVVAETFEAAREASQRIGVTYAPDQAPAARMDAPGAAVQPLDPMTIEAGDFDTAFEAAPAKVDAVYTTPAQHHSPWSCSPRSACGRATD